MTRFYEDGKGTTYTQIMRDVWEVKGLKGNYTVDVENSALLTGSEIIEYCDDPMNIRENHSHTLQNPTQGGITWLPDGADLNAALKDREIYASAQAHEAMSGHASVSPLKANDINLERVKQFHTVFGHPVNDYPNVDDADLNRLRLDLIREETQELWEALNAWDTEWLNTVIKKVQIDDEMTATDKVKRIRELLDMHDNPEKHVADALTDLQYVLDGAWLALGFHRVKEECVAEVHRSNMSKLGLDGLPIKREDGKILKGPNYSLPDLGPIVAKLFEENE